MGKIGKYIVLSILFFVHALCAKSSIKISVYDTNHRPVTQIGQYSQFMIEVTCTDIDVKRAPLDIPGFAQCQAQSFSQKHATSVHNGRTTKSVTFIYTAQCPDEGEYTLGPWTTQGITSNTVHLKVAQRTITQDQTTGKQPEIMIQASVPDQEFFVGQAIPVQYTVRMSEHIDGQEFDAHIMQTPYFDVGNIRVVGDAQYELQNGKEYVVQEYQVFVYPKRAGTISVPPMQITYLVSSGSFFGFLGSLSKQKKAVTSNVAPCVIKPLPQGVSSQQFIGVVESIHMELEKEEIELGQGAVCKVVVRGKGDYDKIPFFDIQTPEHVRVYENKEHVQSQADGSFVKTLEYVVQGVHVGKYKIPEQSWTYFDVHKERIETSVFGKNIHIKVIKSFAHAEQKNVDVVTKTEGHHEEFVQTQKNIQSFVPRADFLQSWAQYILWLWYLLFCILFMFLVQKLFIFSLSYSFFARIVYAYVWLLWWWVYQRRCSSVTQLLQGWRTVFEKLLYVVQKEYVIKEHEYSIVLQAMQMLPEDVEQWNAWYNVVLQKLYDKDNEHNVQDIIQQSIAWTVYLQRNVWKLKK